MAGKRPEGWEQWLDPDETILWRGRPDPRWSWRGGENATILLGLFILGFLTFFTVEALSYDETVDVGPLVPWTIVALLLAASGPVAMAIVRRGTWYTLTSRRAVIAHWPTIAGFTIYKGLDCYPITEVVVAPSDLRGLSTVNVARLSQRHTFLERWERVAPAGTTGIGGGNGARRDQRIGFERIAQADAVASLCREVQANGG